MCIMSSVMHARLHFLMALPPSIFMDAIFNLFPMDSFLVLYFLVMTIIHLNHLLDLFFVLLVKCPTFWFNSYNRFYNNPIKFFNFFFDLLILCSYSHFNKFLYYFLVALFVWIIKKHTHF